MTDDEIAQAMARAIYADSYTDYGTCSEAHWTKTSEVQRQFMLRAAKEALAIARPLIEAALLERMREPSEEMGAAGVRAWSGEIVAQDVADVLAADPLKWPNPIWRAMLAAFEAGRK